LTASNSAELRLKIAIRRRPLCARALSGHPAAAPPSSHMKSRRLIADPRPQDDQSYRLDRASGRVRAIRNGEIPQSQKCDLDAAGNIVRHITFISCDFREWPMSEAELAFALVVVGAIALLVSLGWPWRTSE
jgi:hypothetical protein